ncbi:hypothetical protein [Photobacterium atrarenae]|uniref:Uncharacterized protein n=1 Tax=Photobacterium atrarenae TaxID=865757 RepID=A0ABY5GK84_9GAMM|nr:hypothetical protein [Photobacterium atrarenae]UTV29735.1 hypothetical protein NNL38_22255 [Photobacterium atrarenae]
MYDTEMKLNHRIVQFVDAQLHELLDTESVTESCADSGNQAMHDAMVSILTQYLSGLKAINCLLNKGFVAQTRGIFQTLGDDYEDIIFLSLPCQDGQMTPLHHAYLKSVAGAEYHGCYSPISRCEIRNMIKQAKNINHNVFQLYPKKQALQVLRPHGGKPCSVEVAIDLHRHFAYKAILLAVLTAKVAGNLEVMGACLNFRAHLEMTDSRAVMFDLPSMPQPQTVRSEPRYAAVR